VPQSGESSSFVEASLLHLAQLNYSLERYSQAYDAFVKLRSQGKMEENRKEALYGMMRSAYKAHNYDQAALAATEVAVSSDVTADLKREADYIKAKSYMASSRRDEALGLFRSLSAQPATNEGAEARYILIQDAYDRADYEAVQKAVFDFSDKSGGQNYWLARAYLTLADTFVQIGKTEQAKATLESIRDGYTAEKADDDIQDLVQSRLYKLNI
jgi:TolA-binding protein